MSNQSINYVGASVTLRNLRSLPRAARQALVDSANGRRGMASLAELDRNLGLAQHQIVATTVGRNRAEANAARYVWLLRDRETELARIRQQSATERKNAVEGADSRLLQETILEAVQIMKSSPDGGEDPVADAIVRDLEDKLRGDCAVCMEGCSTRTACCDQAMCEPCATTWTANQRRLNPYKFDSDGKTNCPLCRTTRDDGFKTQPGAAGERWMEHWEKLLNYRRSVNDNALSDGEGEDALWKAAKQRNPGKSIVLLGSRLLVQKVHLPQEKKYKNVYMFSEDAPSDCDAPKEPAQIVHLKNNNQSRLFRGIVRWMWKTDDDGKKTHTGFFVLRCDVHKLKKKASELNDKDTDFPDWVVHEEKKREREEQSACSSDNKRARVEE